MVCPSCSNTSLGSSWGALCWKARFPMLVGLILLVCYLNFLDNVFLRRWSNLHEDSFRSNLVGTTWRDNHTLVIVVPFIKKQANLVLKSMEIWGAAGDPCPFIRQNNVTCVDLTFWFNSNFASDKIFATKFRRDVETALGRNADCFGQVKFLSANLRPEEDKYPVGPSYQWYKAFLSETKGLSGLYDYMFWCEHDVYPIREGFVDKLFEIVKFDGNFWVKGSIHRGELLDHASPKLFDMIEHINGNGLYNFHDAEFFLFVKELLDVSEVLIRRGDPWHFSMDTSIWRFAMTSYKTMWARHVEWANRFVHSDFLQAYSRYVDDVEIGSIIEKSPNTWLIHGNAESTGPKLQKANREKITKSKETFSPTATPVVRPVVHARTQMVTTATGQLALSRNESTLVIMIPVMENDMSAVIQTIHSWEAVGDPCSVIRKSMSTNVDLIFFMNTQSMKKPDARFVFPDDFHASISNALGRNKYCFREVKFHNDGDSGKISLDARPLRNSYLLYSALLTFGNTYDYLFWNEPQVHPIKPGFIDVLLEEVTVRGNFFVKGSINRGNLMNNVRASGEAIFGDSVRRDINALYNIRDESFNKLIRQLRGQGNLTMSFDLKLQRYLKDYVSNWKYIKNNAHHFMYTDVIQSYGTRLSDQNRSMILQRFPNTFLVGEQPQ